MQSTQSLLSPTTPTNTFALPTATPLCNSPYVSPQLNATASYCGIPLFAQGNDDNTTSTTQLMQFCCAESDIYTLDGCALYCNTGSQTTEELDRCLETGLRNLVQGEFDVVCSSGAEQVRTRGDWGMGSVVVFMGVVVLLVGVVA